MASGSWGSGELIEGDGSRLKFIDKLERKTNRILKIDEGHTVITPKGKEVLATEKNIRMIKNGQDPTNIKDSIKDFFTRRSIINSLTKQRKGGRAYKKTYDIEN